ncbi:MAG: UPF0175 family protein [Candidatus Binatia bacterium]
MAQVTFDIPDELLTALGEHPDACVQEMRLLAALEYLHEKRLSPGQAAKFAGIDLLQLLDTLDARGVGAFDRSVKGGLPAAKLEKN